MAGTPQAYIGSEGLSTSEFSDYQCPFCKRFVDLTEPLVERGYVQNSLAQVEFRCLAITGGNASPDENEATLACQLGTTLRPSIVCQQILR
jgi:hypothetical protein